VKRTSVEHERNTQRRLNPVTLERLAANGSDLTRAHRIRNVFHVFSEGHIASLRHDLGRSNFNLEDKGKSPSRHDEQYWEVEVEALLVPNLVSINAMTDRCVEIASRYDAEYDGWYTEVVRGS